MLWIIVIFFLIHTDYRSAHVVTFLHSSFLINMHMHMYDLTYELISNIFFTYDYCLFDDLATKFQE